MIRIIVKSSRILFAFILLMPILLSAQQDSVRIKKIKYTNDFKFTDGIFMNIEEVKRNKPISKARIISDLNYDDYAFFEKILMNDHFVVLDQMGLRKEIKSKDIWGFSQNGILYIYWNKEFNRIPVFGTISHFIADKTYTQQNNNYNNNYNNSYYNPYNPYYPSSTSTTKTELRQYILDMETGNVINYTYQNIEIILMRDAKLYEEFIKLKKKQRKQLKFLYLRKYNEKHPFYIHQEY